LLILKILRLITGWIVMSDFTCDNCGEEYETDMTDQEIAENCNQVDMVGKKIYLYCEDCYRLAAGEEVIH